MKRIIHFFASLRLSMILLFLGVLLVFCGTLDQVKFGIYFTQKKYFESLFAVWDYPDTWLAADALQWLKLPIPGGYIVGPLLVLNLFVAHFKYYQARWKKSGIILIHAGLILLLLGQLWTQLMQRESFMWLAEGEKGNYVESFHRDELVVIDRSGNDANTVVSWPLDAFRHGPTALSNPTLPFRLNVIGYFENAAVFPRAQAPNANFGSMPFDRGIGADWDLVVLQTRPTYADGERNTRTAFVEIEGAQGRLGTWVVSNIFRQQMPMQRPFPPQTFIHDGKTYEIALRFERTYLDDYIELLDFTHDRYPGTEIPFNFSSDVRIIDPETGTTRDTLIYMNHPLRHAGLTFYQASFADNDTRSMFQVVRNPGRWVPYIASTIISLGLLLQFAISLYVRSARKKRPSMPEGGLS